MTSSRPKTKIALGTMLFAAGMFVVLVRLDRPAQAQVDASGTTGQNANRRLPPIGATWAVEGIVVVEQGHPIAGPRVHLSLPNDPFDVRGGKTAADGSFTLTLAADNPVVRGLVAEIEGVARIGLCQFNVVPDYRRPAGRVRIVVKPARTLTIRVKDHAGVAVPGAAVSAVEYGYQACSLTGPDGAAVIPIPTDAGIHWVMAKKSGLGFDYAVYYNEPPLRSPALPPVVDLTLDAARSVRIKAIDSKGLPLPGIRFRAGSIGRAWGPDRSRRPHEEGP